MGDHSINLKPKGERSRASHAIALDVRRRLAGSAATAACVAEVVEVPPGPPVLSTLLAEVYGPDATTRRAVAAGVRKAFEAVHFVVDIDDSFGVPRRAQRFAIDQQALEFLGVDRAPSTTRSAACRRNGGRLFAARQGLKPIAISVALPMSALRSMHACCRRRCRLAARRARARMWSSATS